MEKNKLQHCDITTDKLFDDIRNIVEQGRKQAYAAANQIAVLTYWHIGRRIVEEEQHLKIVNARVHNLTWTHFRAIARQPCKDEEELSREIEQQKRFFLEQHGKEA